MTIYGSWEDLTNPPSCRVSMNFLLLLHRTNVYSQIWCLIQSLRQGPVGKPKVLQVYSQVQRTPKDP